MGPSLNIAEAIGGGLLTMSSSYGSFIKIAAAIAFAN